MLNSSNQPTNTIFDNPTIAALSKDDVLTHVTSVQTKNATTVANYRKRSRKDFTVFMLEARTTIKTLQTNVNADTLAALFTRHQIRAATGDTSEYTPFIKLVFGKPNAAGDKKEFAGEEHVKWEADDSFARYFNFYEVIDRDFDGEEDKLLAWVLDKGGPAKIVEDELARKREEAKPDEDTVTARADLYLAETNMPPVEMPFTVPEKAGRFMSVIIEKTDDGYRMVGIGKKDAQADFDKLAADNFDQLTKAKAEREAEEARQAKATEAVRAEVVANPEKLLDGLNKAQRIEMLTKLTAEAAEVAANATDDQSAA